MSVCFFFFKQKTAYEIRISDWSSDVCSSDLTADHLDLNSGHLGVRRAGRCDAEDANDHQCHGETHGRPLQLSTSHRPHPISSLLLESVSGTSAAGLLGLDSSSAGGSSAGGSSTSGSTSGSSAVGG